MVLLLLNAAGCVDVNAYVWNMGSISHDTAIADDLPMQELHILY